MSISNKKIEPSELIINKDGSIFHLHLKPEELADNVILVGDPGRVSSVSSLFEKIEIKRKNREFVSHTGYFNKKRITVLSTGIGTDNIDIVLNELDALKNIDLQKREVKNKLTSLNIIRIGTSGALQENILPDTAVVSRFAIGFDGVLNFYKNRNNVSNLEMEEEFKKYMEWNKTLASPYFVECSNDLLNKVAFDIISGFTISANGFYGPQGRELRLEIQDQDINDKISNFSYKNIKINNYEMECSAIYGLSKLMNHNALTICVIIANRMRKEYSKNYKLAINKLIAQTLERLTN